MKSPYPKVAFGSEEWWKVLHIALKTATELGIEIGIFFFYALVSAFVGMIVGGIVYGGFINKQDQKNKHFMI